MPPRKQTSRTAPKHELAAFAEKYDTLSEIYGDPVEVVFRIMADQGDPEIKLRAADMLLGYRYPRVKAAEGAIKNAAALNFNVIMSAPPAPSPIPIRAPITVELPKARDE